MQQLKLSTKELKEIGFKECNVDADKMNLAKNYFKLETINGYFYYNPEQDKYAWYHKTIISDVSNDVHLDITNKPELFVLLRCFNTKFNIIF